MSWTRKTRWPIDDERLGHSVEMPNAPGRRMPDDLARAYRDRVFRELVKAVEDRGFTTHFDIVKRACDRQVSEGAYGDREQYRFPPKRPRRGDPLRYENGPLKGDEGTAPDDSGIIVLPDHYIVPTVYHAHAFDTGTGHWIYRTAYDN